VLGPAIKHAGGTDCSIGLTSIKSICETGDNAGRKLALGMSSRTSYDPGFVHEVKTTVHMSSEPL